MYHTESPETSWKKAQYARAASVNRLLARLQRDGDPLLEILAKTMRGGRQEASTVGLEGEEAAFIGHKAVVKYLKEHRADLLQEIESAEIPQENN